MTALLPNFKNKLYELKEAVDAKRYEDAQVHSEELYRLIQSEDVQMASSELETAGSLLREYIELNRQMIELKLKIASHVLRLFGIFGG